MNVEQRMNAATEKYRGQIDLIVARADSDDGRAFVSTMVKTLLHNMFLDGFSDAAAVALKEKDGGSKNSADFIGRA